MGRRRDVLEETMSVVLVERLGRVAVVTLNEPERLNPLGTYPGGSEDHLKDALLDLEHDDEIRVLVLTGAGRAFSAGADLRNPAEYTTDQRIEREIAEPLGQLTEDKSLALWFVLERYPKPIVAAVNGLAIGGGWELALYCDMIIVDEEARFRLAELELGRIPPHFALYGTRSAGRYKVSDLMFSGRWLSAREADDIGLVSRVVPAGTVLQEALSLAEHIAEVQPLVLKLAKQAVRRSLTTPLEWKRNHRDQLLLGLSDAGKTAWREYLERRQR
jgi:enoyl-CoA hydratase